jgi:hypothetical protein
MEPEPEQAPAADAGAGAAEAAPVVRSFTFTPVTGDWADDDEEEDGREGARASILEELKAKYHTRCGGPGTPRSRLVTVPE